MGGNLSDSYQSCSLKSLPVSPSHFSKTIWLVASCDSFVVAPWGKDREKRKKDNDADDEDDDDNDDDNND